MDTIGHTERTTDRQSDSNITPPPQYGGGGRGAGHSIIKSNGSRQKKKRRDSTWNQMTTLRFQTGGKHQTSLASLWGPQKVVYH